MDRRQVASSISGGIFLISLGVLALTNWWWPGIMLALGLAAGAELVFRGQYVRAVIVFAIFAAIPFLVTANIPWPIVGPLVLIALGVVVLVKTLFLRDGQ